ncbi:hypothetical protein [uncultured Spirosoma sp.]|uniref:hypothetical protein n=1 Tax=uncultured Spirosoma sp. TaxID=278208 RepID=UPI00258A2E83|nr:hypothetical protein [uncultured Spirosoma sp.]
MNLSEEEYDEIDDFLNKRMAPAQAAAFQERLAQNETLRQEVAMQHLINQGIEAAALKQQFKSLRKGVQRQRITRRAGRGIVVALLLVMTVGVSYWFYQQTQPLRPEAAFVAYYTPAPRTRADGPVDPRIEAARNSYYAGQYALSLSQLAGVPTDSLLSVPYLRGLNQLVLNRPGVAIQNLTAARQSPDLATRQQADWYTALAYLRANQIPQAKVILTTIRTVSGQPYKDVANELLKKLP